MTFGVTESIRATAIAALVAAAAASAPPPAAGSTDLGSLQLRGRLHLQWSGSAAPGDRGSFSVRRGDLALGLRFSPHVYAAVQPHWSYGEFELRALARVSPLSQLDLTFGTTKRQFDTFWLESASRLLVIERDGRIADTRVPSFSRLTRTLGHSGRHYGAIISVRSPQHRMGLDLGVSEAGEERFFGDAAYQARLSVALSGERPLSAHSAISITPFVTAARSGHAPAYELALLYGSFDSGTRVQTAVAFGDNWKRAHVEDVDPRDTPAFFAWQVIAAVRTGGSDAARGVIEPLLRAGWADPSLRHAGDAGLLLTPGVNVYVSARNRLSANVDVFVPERGARLWGPKVQTWLHW